MNILKRELRAGLKPFIFWAIGIFVLVYVGIIKYEGFSSAGVSMNEMLSQFPRPVLAILGITGVDPQTLSGYTAILTYYGLICAVIYSVHLGSNAVSRESIDKTYEFVFTKPGTRSRVLAFKLLAAWLYLLLFCIVYAVFSSAAAFSIKASESIGLITALFSLSVFLIGSLFIALSAFFSAVSRRPDKGSLWGNLAFLYALIIGVLYDMLENGGALRVISPFKYFQASDILAGRLSPLYIILTAVVSAALLFFAFDRFNKKDLL